MQYARTINVDQPGSIVNSNSMGVSVSHPIDLDALQGKLSMFAA